MLIRRMLIDDYEELYQLWMSCAGMGLNNLDDSREGVERFLSRNPETCFVAEADNRLAGVIMAGHDGRRGYIYHTAVDPKYRSQKIASELVKSALSALAQLGINKVALVVFAKNEIGNAFWKKLGFNSRSDLIYRDKALADNIVRIDT